MNILCLGFLVAIATAITAAPFSNQLRDADPRLLKDYQRYQDELDDLLLRKLRSAWDGFIDALVRDSIDSSGTANIDKACIIGLDGAKWTGDGHAKAFKLTQSEVSTIASAFANKDFSTFRNNGIIAEGIKYSLIRQDDKFVNGWSAANEVITMRSSNTAVVIAHAPKGKNSGAADEAVKNLAEYLEDAGM